MGDQGEGTRRQSSTHTRRPKERKYRWSNKAHERRRWRTRETFNDLSAPDRLGEREDRGKGTEMETKNIPGGNRNIATEERRKDSPQRIQQS